MGGAEPWLPALAGLILALFGRRLYHLVFPLGGFLVGATIGLWLALVALDLFGLEAYRGAILAGAGLAFGLASAILFRWLRRVLVFLGGFVVGIVLRRAITHGAQMVPVREVALSLSPSFADLGLPDLLAGAAGGGFFLLFEGLFAIVLTALLGALLLTAAFGARWVFPVSFGSSVLLQWALGRRRRR
ncbi:MAG: hypothetical protein HYV08_14000 [Deltaproteobacteria bacterium]|nr:hypothetical protein [Deltaproteobacteria bacterium]